MSGGSKNIGDIIREIVKDGSEIYSLPCKVMEVNGEEADLAPLNGDATILGVKLIAGSSGTPLLITPAVDSVVIATFTSKDTAFISLYSEIEEIQLRGDQYGGLIKIEDLVNKINAIENKINALVTTFNSHVHTTAPFTPIAGSPIPTSPTATPETPITPTTQRSDLENEQVKHG